MSGIIKVTCVASLGKCRPRTGFSNRSEGERDFADVISKGDVMVEPLADERCFARVFIELGTLAWPNGVDIDANAPHDEMEAAGLLHRRAA